ncbi:MAG: 4Fe-4S dicluster domain-containing protein, partial [Phycisphaerae bacterium]|nr:4Fe-4S dicluster domain-containing protein [Phycisphaerae bacterium]
CMKACPSGALRLVEPTDIRMGAARVRLDRCLRSQGQDCSLCVDKCPMGLRAIQLNGGHVEVIVGGCVGCGSCQFYCPAMPKAIVVDPQ